MNEPMDETEAEYWDKEVRDKDLEKAAAAGIAGLQEAWKLSNRALIVRWAKRLKKRYRVEEGEL